MLFAQPNYLYALIEDKQQAASSGEADPPEYMPAKVRLEEAHQLARGSKVLVAVIDSGIDVSHSDLAGDIVNTFDAIGVARRSTSMAPRSRAASPRTASCWCGTGRADPGRPRLRRHRRAENGTTFAIMKGLDWSVLNGARIINMSFSARRIPA